MDKFLTTQPIYVQIMDRIKKEIVSETIKSGQLLPSVRDLALKYQVNPNTTQRALSELERSGLVKSDRTIGRYVTDDASLIQNLHDQMVIDIVDNFVNEVMELNVNEKDSLSYISQAFKERTKND